MQAETQAKRAQCPNRGPGRYEGNAYPCLAAAFDHAVEYANDTVAFGDDEALDFFRGPFNGPQDLADLSGEICQTCMEAFPFHGASLATHSDGFRFLHLYANETVYHLAHKDAVKDAAEFNQEA